MLVLLGLAVLGAWLFGPIGAIAGYLVGVIVGTFLPDASGSCAVQPDEEAAPEAEPEAEQDTDAA